MKLIIKNDSKETVKNPNVKIIETTEASFINQTVFIEENDVPIIKYTDTESMYFVKDLDNLYDRKSKSEVLLDITIDNLEAIGSGSGGDFVPLTGTEPGSPVTGEIEVVEAGRTIFLNNWEVDNSLVIAEGGTSIIAEDLINTYIAMISVEPSSNKVEVNCNNPVSRGLTAAQDFTNNITDLDYTQKKYVDERGSVFNSTTSVLSASDLNTAYPNAKDGFSVIAPNVVGGGKYYIKAEAGWVYQQILTVV